MLEDAAAIDDDGNRVSVYQTTRVPYILVCIRPTAGHRPLSIIGCSSHAGLLRIEFFTHNIELCNSLSRLPQNVFRHCEARCFSCLSSQMNFEKF